MQFGLLAVGLVVAWTQVREAVRLREESTRPFVSIDLYVEDSMIYLRVENFGPTMARNVHFEFHPTLRSHILAERIDSLTMFREHGIPTLPPRKAIETVFDAFPARELAGGYEDTYRVSVTYQGEPGKCYSDDVVLDLGVYRDRVSVRRHTLHEIHDVLARMSQELAKCSASLQALRQG